jgi:putative ABC transport system permease protein
MIHFLLKGLLRDKSRSLFPVLIVAAGVFITILMYTFLLGVVADMIESNAKFDAGHLKVVTRAYREISDQMPNDYALTGVKSLLQQLGKEETRVVWTPRIRIGGLLDIPDSRGETRVQGPVYGLGVNLFGADSPEPDILNLRKALVAGSLPRRKNEILLSGEFAGKLNLKVGDTATLISSTMNGDMAIHNFTVSGLLKFGITGLDRGTFIADISDARDALDMEDAASEIVGFSRSRFYDDKLMTGIRNRFANAVFKSRDRFAPVMLALRDQGDMGMMIDIMDIYFLVIIGIFVLVMSVVLWNSGLMNGIRRYGEIGIRLAMGEQKGAIYRRMIAESFFLGVTGTALGTLLGLAFSYYLQEVGIDITGMLQQSSVIMGNVMRARVNAVSCVIGFIPGLLAPVLGTVMSGLGIYRRQTSQLFKEL